MTLEQLTVVIDAKTSGLKKEMSNVKNTLGKLETATEKSSNKISQSLAKITKYLSVGTIVAGLTKIGKAAVEAASDLAEVQNVVDVAFGSLAYRVDSFAKSAIYSFGLSETQAKQTASTLMAMANSMGVATDDAYTMSLQLTGLSGDMASFYNVTQDVTDTALRSVFTGETETLKKFGIVMTEANLEAYALSKGITESYRSMSQAEKVLLRYNYVLENTRNSQNDYSRTSGEWANQLRLLANQWQTLLSIIGTYIKNALLPALQTLNKAITYIIEAYNYLNKGKGEKATIAQDAEEGAKAIDDETESVANLKKQMQGFDELNILGTEDSTSTGGGNFDLEPITYFDADKDDAGQQAEETVNAIKEKVKKFFTWLEENSWVKILLGSVAGIAGLGVATKVIDKVTNKIGLLHSATGLFSKLLAKIGFSKLLSPFEWLSGALKGNVMMFDEAGNKLSKFQVLLSPMMLKVVAIAAAIGLVIAALVNLYNTNDEFKEKVDTAWENIKNVITNVYENVIVPVFEGIKTLWETLVKPVLEMIWKLILYIVEVVASAVLDLWNGALAPALVSITEMIGTVIKALMPIVEAIIGFLMPAIQSVIDIVAVVLKALEPVVNFIVQHLIVGINGIIGVLKGVITFLTGVFTGNWEMAWKGIKDIFTSIWDTMKNVWSNIANFLKPIVDKIKTLFSNMWDGIKSGAKAAINFIIKVLNGLIDGINILAAPLRLIILAIAKVSGSSASFSDIAIPHIPYLAKGGVITGPTLAMLGEYGGASSNPEIAAPESKLREIFAEGNNDLIDVWISTTKQIITAINNKDMNVSINDDAIGRSVVRANAANKMRTGMALI